MTEALTRRRVLAIALPILAANALEPLLGAADTAVIGQLGRAEPIAAVAIGAAILTAVYWVFGFLRMGTSGMVAQARGAEDAPEIAALLTRGILIGLVAGLGFVALQGPIVAGTLRLWPAEAEVEALTAQYLSIRIWAAPAAIAHYAVSGWLIAMERTRALFLVQAIAGTLNLGLNVLFTLGLGWGVSGVAVATGIAELTAVALGLIACRSAFRQPAWRDWPRVFDAARLRRMVAVNAGIMVRSVLLILCILSVPFLSSRLGTATLAANRILMDLITLSAHALDGFAFAAEALVGQAVGRGDRAALRRAAWLTSEVALVVALGTAAAIWLAGPAIIARITTAEDVVAIATLHLPFVALAVLVGLPSWMLDGIFIGATRTRDMVTMTVAATVIYAVAVALLWPWGNWGLWTAFMIFYVARAATLALRYPALEAQVSAPAPTA